MEKKKLSNFKTNFRVIGFPDDLGIKNVKGRPGAAEGPARFLQFFSKLNGNIGFGSNLLNPLSVPMGDDLAKNHDQATQAVAEASKNGECVIAIGGGHDYAYPWIKGLASTYGKKVGCINLDAHFDLRSHEPVMTSGSPFRRLIEEKILPGPNLVEFGIQEHCNGPELWEFARANKVKIVPFSKVRNGKAVPEFKKALSELRRRCSVIFFSVDLDALSLAYCPGVSAPQGEGFTGSDLYQMMEIAGSDRKVASLGIFELSPPLDFQDLTARLAAQAAWHFVARKLVLS